MKKSAGKRSCANRLLAFVLVAVMLFCLCACGETDKDNGGGRESMSNNVGNVVGDDSGVGTDDAASGSGVDTSDRVLWVEILSVDEVHIYLKDEVVNGMRSGTDADGNPVSLNEVGVTFRKGEGELCCYLSYFSSSVIFTDGQSMVFDGRWDKEDHYANDTICWVINSKDVARFLQNCDSGWATYSDYEDASNSKTFLELSSPQEVAALLGDIVVPERTEGVKLAFDGDFVYMELFGEKWIQAGIEESAGVNANYPTLALGSSELPYSNSYTIQLNNIENGIFRGAQINSYTYPSKGVLYESQRGESERPRLLYIEQDENRISVWFYAPGFENAAKSNSDYYFYCRDNGKEFLGSKGSLNEILCDYVPYHIPELPADFLVEVKGADKDYFAPLTPNYSVVRYDYPQIPMTTDFKWHLVLTEGPTYGYMSVHTELTSGTKLVLTSYDNFGNVVQVREKCIYENEETAIHAHVPRHTILQKAIGETFGTEADFVQWIYDGFSRKSIEYSAHNVMLAHEGNVVYYAPYYNTTVLVSEADDLWDVPMDSAEFGVPYTVQSGSAVYSYNYGDFSESDGKGTCTYKTYCTF